MQNPPPFSVANGGVTTQNPPPFRDTNGARPGVTTEYQPSLRGSNEYIVFAISEGLERNIHPL